MCTGAELLLVSGTGLSLLGQGMQMSSDQEQAEHAAAQADLQAIYTEQQAAQEADLVRRIGRDTRKAATAAYAGSGVDVNSETALAVDREIVRNTESDAIVTLLNGQRQAEALRAGAGMYREAGSDARRAGAINMAGTALSAGYTYNRWKTA